VGGVFLALGGDDILRYVGTLDDLCIFTFLLFYEGFEHEEHAEMFHLFISEFKCLNESSDSGSTN
jgi:hypothetical protein